MSADEMLKELGYTLDEEDEYAIYYIYKNNSEVILEFNKEMKSVELSWYSDDIALNIKVLPAIVKKCEELRVDHGLYVILI